MIGAFFWFIIRFWTNKYNNYSKLITSAGGDGETCSCSDGKDGGQEERNKQHQELDTVSWEEFFVERNAPLLAHVTHYMKHGSSNVVAKLLRRFFSILLPSSPISKSITTTSATTKDEIYNNGTNNKAATATTTEEEEEEEANSSSTNHPVSTSSSSSPSLTLSTNQNDTGALLPPPPAPTSSPTNNTNNSNTAIKRIYENQQLIKSILYYWFGQYTIDNAQKMLWMISNSSVELRNRVDEEITNKFQSILVELISSETTETSTSANNSNSTSGGGTNGNGKNGTSGNNYRRRYSEWCYDYDGIYGIHGKIATIIVLDQFSRHILRYHSNNKTNNNKNSQPSVLLPFQQVDCDILALQTSELLFEKHPLELSTGGIISLPMYIFSLMPYRHSKQLPQLIFVQDCIESTCQSNYVTMNDNMLKRFRKATNRRVALIQDELRRTGGGKQNGGGIISGENGNTKINNDAPTTMSDDSIMTSTTTATTASLLDEEEVKLPPIVATKDDESTLPTFKDEDILETFPFEADMMSVTNHPVYKTIISFLIERGIHLDMNDDDKKTTTKNDSSWNGGKGNKKTTAMMNKSQGGKKKQKTNQKKQKQQGSSKASSKSTSQLTSAAATRMKIPIIVSLSGGVDSMVIISVLSHLQKQLEKLSKSSNSGDHPNRNGDGTSTIELNVIAVHIDYANRPESFAEANYVRKYCEEMLGNITFYCRRIDHITRGITSRDDYERLSRDIRYDMYKYAMKEAATTAASKGNDEFYKLQISHEIGVMLGHHRGDLRENVLSNAHKGCGPLDLSGMTSVSQNNGVTIYRPLLPLEKEVIFDYAHKFGVPYFKDTTPHWSTRGKLRNKLLPLLEEIYGEGSMNNLSTLATESDDCRDLLYEVMIGPFMQQVVRKPMGIIFDTAPWKNNAVFFWKFVLRELLHSAGLGMFTDKSVISFLERVQVDTIRPGWLQCRKDYAVYLLATGRVYILYPSSFPWHKQDQYKMKKQGEFRCFFGSILFVM